MKKEHIQIRAIKPILSRYEMASFLGISLSTLDTQIKEGMPHFTIGNGKRGGLKRFCVEEVMLWLRSKSK